MAIYNAIFLSLATAFAFRKTDVGRKGIIGEEDFKGVFFPIMLLANMLMVIVFIVVIAILSIIYP